MHGKHHINAIKDDYLQQFWNISYVLKLFVGFLCWKSQKPNKGLISFLFSKRLDFLRFFKFFFYLESMNFFYNEELEFERRLRYDNTQFHSALEKGKYFSNKY